MNKYENGTITFKGLKIDWNKYRTEKNKHGEHEVFNIEVEDTYKNKIRFDFHNSIMEKRISDLISPEFGLRELKRTISKRYMWGGYDDVKNIQEFRQERIKNLLYSVLNCMANDINAETDTFKNFCDCFGYDEDSRTAYKTYKEVELQKEKLFSLNINWAEWDYIAQEEEPFKKELIKSLEV